MAELKCEYPEGCRLDLWAKVIKAKYIERKAKVLEELICVPSCPPSEGGVGGYIQLVDDFKVKVNKAEEVLNFNKVKVCVNFDIILIVLVDGSYQIVNLPGNIYEETIELNQFDPPLTIDEFRNEIDQSEIILSDWAFDYEIKGRCEDLDSPCKPNNSTLCTVKGTCLYLTVYVDLIDKLGKMHDIIVYGELDPEIDI